MLSQAWSESQEGLIRGQFGHSISETRDKNKHQLFLYFADIESSFFLLRRSPSGRPLLEAYSNYRYFKCGKGHFALKITFVPRSLSLSVIISCSLWGSERMLMMMMMMKKKGSKETVASLALFLALANCILPPSTEELNSMFTDLPLVLIHQFMKKKTNFTFKYFQITHHINL